MIKIDKKTIDNALEEYQQTGQLRPTARKYKIAVNTLTRYIKLNNIIYINSNNNINIADTDNIKNIDSNNKDKNIAITNDKLIDLKHFNKSDRVISKLLDRLDSKKDIKALDYKIAATAYGILMDKKLKIRENNTAIKPSSVIFNFFNNKNIAKDIQEMQNNSRIIEVKAIE